MIMSNPISLALFGGIGTYEILVILLLALLLFGGKKLPELAKGMGRSLRVFKSELSGVKHAIDEAGDDDTTDTTPAKGKAKDANSGQA